MSFSIQIIPENSFHDYLQKYTLSVIFLDLSPIY